VTYNWLFFQLVNYRSGGLRLNPNLYDSGKVCLSLLNTWSGHGCEKWNPSNSTMLQVLVSIQALVLNAKPYFNEPGYAASANTPQGEKMSMAYNESTFLLSCRTMLYSLRNPPKVWLHYAYMFSFLFVVDIYVLFFFASNNLCCHFCWWRMPNR
jgi:ubiquitin-conjugating enzyme E2 O